MSKRLSLLFSGILSALLVFSVSGSLSKAAVYEQESNDDFASANKIAVNTEVIGSLSDDAGKDYYKFSLDNNGVIKINFSNAKVLESINKWYIDLYNADGDSITSFTAYEDNTGASSSSIGLPKGEYYIGIESEYRNFTNYLSEADYKVKVSYTKSNYWETEFNDNFQNADTIPVNTEINGTLGDQAKEDYYKFKLDDNGVIKINFSNAKVLESINKWYIHLYNADGKTITSFTAYENTTGITSSSVGLSKGEYYISINSEYRNFTDYTSYADYKFKVSYTKSDAWENEGNDSFETADLIRVNTDVNGSLGNSSNDYYKFAIDNDGYINVVFSNTEVVKSEKFWYLEIINSNGDTMESYQTSESNNGFTSWTLGIPKGEYYIKISGKDSKKSSADYSFKVSYTQSDNWEKEFDNNYSSAVNIGTESVMNGTALNETDYYKLSIPEMGNYRLEFKHIKVPGSKTGWDISFQDEHGKEISVYKIQEVENETGIYNLGFLPARDYYIVLKGDCGYSYSFSVNRFIYPTNVTAVDNVKDGLRVTWGQAREYTSYDLYRQEGPQGQKVLLKSGLTTNMYLDTSAKTEGINYGYSVVVNKDIFKSDISSVSYRYRLNPMSIKKAKKKKKTVILSWAKHKNADGFIIEYSTNKKFKKNVKSITVKGSNKASRKITKLKSKKTYYFRIRSYKGSIYYTSVWSKTFKVKVK